ncbi:hypothetical protein Gotri_010236, partial [Gossypium trilobum]|nr:hypothetical protein [Gossypium trilobum]
ERVQQKHWSIEKTPFKDLLVGLLQIFSQPCWCTLQTMGQCHSASAASTSRGDDHEEEEEVRFEEDEETSSM